MFGFTGSTKKHNKIAQKLMEQIEDFQQKYARLEKTALYDAIRNNHGPKSSINKGSGARIALNELPDFVFDYMEFSMNGERGNELNVAGHGPYSGLMLVVPVGRPTMLKVQGGFSFSITKHASQLAEILVSEHDVHEIRT